MDSPKRLDQAEDAEIMVELRERINRYAEADPEALHKLTLLLLDVAGDAQTSDYSSLYTRRWED